MSVGHGVDKGMRRAPSNSQIHTTGTNIVPFPTSAGSSAIMSLPSRIPKVSGVSHRKANSQSQFQIPSLSHRFVTGHYYTSLVSPSTPPTPFTSPKCPAATPAQPSDASTPTSKTTMDSTATSSPTIISDSTSSDSSSTASTSVYEPSIILGNTRSRKISSAQEVAAKCRAVWAMREKLDIRANRWVMDDAPRWGSAGMMGGLAHGYRSTGSSEGSTPSSNADASVDVDENMAMRTSEETRDPTLMDYPVPPQLALPVTANQLSQAGIPWPVSRYLLSQATSSEAKENLSAIDTSASPRNGSPPSPKARRRQSRLEGLERVVRFPSFYLLSVLPLFIHLMCFVWRMMCRWRRPH